MIIWSLSPCRTVILAGESRSSIWVEVDAIPRSWFLMINGIIIDDVDVDDGFQEMVVNLGLSLRKGSVLQNQD